MKFLRVIDYIFPPKAAWAHCDIPCGIYDPYAAQVAAQTVLRMTGLIAEAGKANGDSRLKTQTVSQIARLTKVKEEHAELVKHEVRVIWGDYFKTEMLGKDKGLHDLVFKIMKAASLVKQNVDIEACNDLVVLVGKFSQIFWESKGRKTQKIKSGYPTEGELVVPI